MSISKMTFSMLCCLWLVGTASTSSIGMGLLYPNGIEPGDPSVCEAPQGNRCWWVDADAPAGGDGSFQNPYNSFESVAGYMNGASYVQGLIQGGDILYVRGTFRASLHDELNNNMAIRLSRGTQGGTQQNPTIIKSWRGSPRAVFDGEYLKRDLIRINGFGSTPIGGIKIQNIEIYRADGRGIYISENVYFAEVVSVLIREGKGNGSMGTGGGIMFGMTDGPHEYIMRNSLIHGNHRNQIGGNNNVGGISILSENWTQSGSIIKIFDNVIYDEVHPVRHKHSGNITMEAYDNLIHDSQSAFYLRSWVNRIHHNIIYNVVTAVDSDSENQTGDTLAEIYNNTIYNTSNLVWTGTGQATYERIINAHDNIFYNPLVGDSILALGRWGSNIFDITEWSSSYNLYFIDLPANNFLYHQGTGFNYSGAMTYLNDTTSFTGDPLFEDPTNGDFRLKQGSDAIGTGTSGIDIGALPSGSPPPLAKTPQAPRGFRLDQ